MAAAAVSFYSGVASSCGPSLVGFWSFEQGSHSQWYSVPGISMRHIAKHAAGLGFVFAMSRREVKVCDAA